MSNMITRAAAAYTLDAPASWDAYKEKLARWVGAAVESGATLLVFPEYGAMELAALAGADVGRDLTRSAKAVSERMDEATGHFADLAKSHHVCILTPSGPVWEDGRFVNRATFVGPDGVIGHQDKQIMTRYERETWSIAPGGPLMLMDTPMGVMGVLICYDCEFPLLARALVEAGADILLVPSNTDTAAGYNRVRIGAMARALENQCVVVQSCTVGDAPWCEAVNRNTGAAGVFGPPDVGFPDTGVLSIGALDTAGWTIASFERDVIQSVRSGGQVTNHQDWVRQLGD